ncbi:MAG: TraB/GumN family protein [Pseudomonadota bacterium]
MIRTVLTTLFIALPAFTWANSCGTRDLIAELSTERQAALNDLVSAHAFAEGNLFRAVNADSVVTVVGTLHLPDARHDHMVDKVRGDIETADLLILEATSAAQLEIQNMTATRPDLFFINEGPTLIDLLSEEEWARLTDELSAYGIPGFMAAKFQPWFLGMTLAIPPCAVADVQAGGKGLDALLEAIAVEANTPIAELDDVEALMQLLAGDPLEEQLDGLRLWLAMNQDGDAEMTTLVERYFQGKAREVIEYSRLTLPEKGVPPELFEEMMQGLLEDRNIAWEPKLIELVAGRDAVLAVGAAHLSGDSGVLRALERAGYKITRQ